MARILIIEDEANLRFAIRSALARAQHVVDEASAIGPAWDLTRQNEYDFVLTDVNLGGENGIDLVKRLREDGFDAPIVVMTAYGSVENAVGAMRLGADDYLQKPVSLDELGLLVARLQEQRKLKSRLKLFERLEGAQPAGDGVLGSSDAWRSTLALAERLAAIPLPATGGKQAGAMGGALPTILLLGETGAGKGVLARHIHERARGGDGTPLVHINCAALPPNLVEGELFGHERGAFTDAKAAREGLLEIAEGGTIFLDEIGDMPLDLQTKILTVVEEGRYRRVGGGKERTVRARLIAATNQDLELRVAEGKFRRDLLYRLNAFTVRIPPLRERGDDAVEIGEAMLARLCRDFGRPTIRLTEDARRAIRNHPWPGNVRELANVMQRVAMLSDGAQASAASLGLSTLAAPGAAASAPNATSGPPGELVFDFDHGVHTADEVEKELIIQALRRTGGNVSKAARLIGMQRSSLRYRIEQYQLHEQVQELTR